MSQLSLLDQLESDHESLPLAGHVRAIPWLANVVEWLTKEAAYGPKSPESYESFARCGSLERTSLEFCRSTAGGIGLPSCGTWQNWGMGSPIAFSTLSGSEWPNDADVCSLSDILETGDVPSKYFLSATACRGILRRAEKRGRELPPALHEALTQAAKADTPDEGGRTT